MSDSARCRFPWSRYSLARLFSGRATSGCWAPRDFFKNRQGAKIEHLGLFCVFLFAMRECGHVENYGPYLRMIRPLGLF